MLDGFDTLLREKRHSDAALRFIEQADPNDLDTRHTFLSDLLPALISQQASGLIKNSGHFDLFLKLCTRALPDGYSPPQMVFHITHLRCYKAVVVAAN